MRAMTRAGRAILGLTERSHRDGAVLSQLWVWKLPRVRSYQEGQDEGNGDEAEGSDWVLGRRLLVTYQEAETVAAETRIRARCCLETAEVMGSKGQKLVDCSTWRLVAVLCLPSQSALLFFGYLEWDLLRPMVELRAPWSGGSCIDIPGRVRTVSFSQAMVV